MTSTLKYLWGGLQGIHRTTNGRVCSRPSGC